MKLTAGMLREIIAEEVTRARRGMLRESRAQDPRFSGEKTFSKIVNNPRLSAGYSVEDWRALKDEIELEMDSGKPLDKSTRTLEDIGEDVGFSGSEWLDGGEMLFDALYAGE